MRLRKPNLLPKPSQRQSRTDGVHLPAPVLASLAVAEPQRVAAEPLVWRFRPTFLPKRARFAWVLHASFSFGKWTLKACANPLAPSPEQTTSPRSCFAGHPAR